VVVVGSVDGVGITVVATTAGEEKSCLAIMSAGIMR
jgi:hypothetical protein